MIVAVPAMFLIRNREPSLFVGRTGVRLTRNRLAQIDGIAASGFTLAAYSQLLAVHNTTGAAIPAAAALTNLGHSGEHFDAKPQ